MTLVTHAPPRPATPAPLFPRLELPRIELCFRDGQRIWLRGCNNDPLTRTVDLRGEALRVDLRELCPSLEETFNDASKLDKPAVIFFLLRHQYPTLDSFLTAVQAHGSSRVNGSVSTNPATGATHHG